MLKLLLHGALLLRFMIALGLQAEEYTLIDRVVQLDFVPRQAIFLVETGAESFESVQGMIFGLPQENAGDKKRWILGCKIPRVKTAENALASVLILGENGAFAYAPPVSKGSSDSHSPAELRERLVQRKAVLQSLRVQATAQDESLRRLRDDADAIGNFGRIIEAQDENKYLIAEEHNLEKDIERLKKFLTLAKEHPQPKNFVRRELELSQQLARLSELSKHVENDELTRRSEAEGDLQRQLEMVEATRFEDISKLQSELQNLRRKRESLGGSESGGGSDDEYGNQRIQ